MSTPTAYGPQLLTLESMHGPVEGNEERFAFLADAASYTQGVEEITNPNGAPGILRTCAIYSIANSMDLTPTALVDGMEQEMERLEVFGVKVPPHTTYVGRSAANGRAYTLTDVAYIPDATTPPQMDGEQKDRYTEAFEFTYDAMRAYYGCSRDPSQLVFRDLAGPRQFAATPNDLQRMWCLDIGPPVGRRSRDEIALQLSTLSALWRRISANALADYNTERNM